MMAIKQTDKEIFNAALGLRLMQQRQSRKLSQKQLGARIGLKETQVRYYEHGTSSITAHKLMQWADVLDKPLEYFIYGDEAANRFGRHVTLTAAELEALPDAETKRAIFDLVTAVSRALRTARNDNGSRRKNERDG